MKQILTCLLTLLWLSTSGQNEFPKDTIKNFYLNLQKDILLPMSELNITIDNSGNVNCMFYMSNQEKKKRDTIAQKKISLDFNTFRQVKEQLLLLGLDTLPAERHCLNVMDGAIYEVEITYNDKYIHLYGSNRRVCDDAFDLLIFFLENLVGFHAIDYE